MSDYLGGRLHERIDNFLVKHFDRPTREERYANRLRMAPQAVEGALIGASLAVGTGRVRGGLALSKAGFKTITTAARPLNVYTLRSYRHVGREAVRAVPQFIRGAHMIEKGHRMKRQGRILQGAGLLGWWRSRK